MPVDSDSVNLTNHFLIAMPSLTDDVFSKSVVFVCEHTQRGALGLVINKPAELKLPDLFAKVDLPLNRLDLTEALVYQGGPMQTERGFVLHDCLQAIDNVDSESNYASTMTIPGGLGMTTSKDVLEAMAKGGGPSRVLVTLGYSAWGEGQLESELSENSWLTVQADLSVIFETPANRRYEKALSLLGIEFSMLSNQIGHA